MALKDRFDEAFENFKANEIVKRTKLHLTENKDRYIVGIGVAGITVLIMRGVASQPISRDTVVAAEGAIGVLGKKVVMSNVSFISSYRQGPPSWVVRCLETGDIFTSQNAASIAMDIPASELSRHLNGVLDHVRDLHFERIALAG